MKALLLQAVNLSISASYFVLAVLLLRPLLKKAPRWVSVALWGLVGLRLALPFSIESVLSLIPSAQTIPTNLPANQAPSLQSGLSAVDQAVNSALVELLPPAASATPTLGTAADAPLEKLLFAASILWLCGIMAMLAYTTVSYLRLRRRVADAVCCQDNIYRSEHISSPFVLGILRPRIYLPASLRDADLPHVIAHEQAHIARRDHWWKPLGFVLLSIYWFNPVLWVAYCLLSRDIELACDEKVIKTLGHSSRVDYSQALLSCSISRRSIAACPLAFGEVSVKQRIQKALNYKRPGTQITLVALAVSLSLGVAFLTDPVQAENPAPAESTATTAPSQAVTPPASDPAPDTESEAAQASPVFIPSPAIPETIEMEITYPSDLNTEALTSQISGMTYEEVVARFGKEGVAVNCSPNRYFWQINGVTIVISFSQDPTDPDKAVVGSVFQCWTCKPANTEAVRQDFLGIAPEDIDAVTLTGTNSQGSTVTVTLSDTLAAQALAAFQHSALDADIVGIGPESLMSYPEIYLTILCKDGSQTTVEFSSLLRIGAYWFAPTMEKQLHFRSDLYLQLLQLLEA